MKFGIRMPSLTKRFAAQTSLKRQLVHRAGLKMPRGYGWLRDPRKALYNRVYNRVTVDPLRGIGVIAGTIFAVLFRAVTFLITAISSDRRRR